MGLFDFFKEKKVNIGQKETKKLVEKDDDWITINIPGTNFFGQFNESKSGNYTVAFQDGHAEYKEWKAGVVILLNQQDTIIWKKSFQRPNNVHVSNSGIVAIEDWENTNTLSGRIIIVDQLGNKIMEYQLPANIGASNISADGKFIVVSTCNPDNSIYLINILEKTLAWKVKNPSKMVALDLLIIDGKISVGIGKSVATAEVEYKLDLDGKFINETI